MTAHHRIIDANANRAREGLRTIEDAARFILDHGGLAESAKSIRHQLTAAVDRIPHLVEHRNTPDDVGTTISTASETRRPDVRAVITAAARRASEAMRTIEEFAKIDAPAIAAAIERARYATYDLEQQVLTSCDEHFRRAIEWPLCVILSEDVCAGRPWEEVAQAVFVSDDPPACVQIREKHLDDRALLTRLERALELAMPGTDVIINDRPDLARMTGARGVHLGQNDLPSGRVREQLGESFVIGVSTDSIDVARRAHAECADYVGLGPMFPTTTKQKDVIVGPEYLSAYLDTFSEGSSLPHLAIGGITLENLPTLLERGCTGIAVSSAVCAADDPAESVSQFNQLMRSGAVV